MVAKDVSANLGTGVRLHNLPSECVLANGKQHSKNY